MTIYKPATIALLALFSLKSYAQKIATFEVELPLATSGLSFPASVNLDDVTYVTADSLSLVEIVGKSSTPVAFQVQSAENRTLSWMVDDKTNPGKKHIFQLSKGVPDKFEDVNIKNEDGALTFQSGDKNLLRYYYRTFYPPAGIDTNYKRSGFIHPLWTPKGQKELTRIQAPDHYHHYGIWNPWTHVLFEKDTVDFWNIKGHQGTVRFAKFVSVNEGDVFSEFKALHEHVVFKKDGTEKVALNELQTVKVYKPDANGDYYFVDITSEMSCASSSPFEILPYRYAGLGWRTTDFWDSTNCEVLTSEGNIRKNTDNTKARWCIVQGALPANDYGGAVMLSYPGNRNHPEPMRIWDEKNNRGKMFANFSPTKDQGWLLEPGKTYVLKYRFVVFSGKFDKSKAESSWQYFAKPPKVTIKK
jgi:hypothetical protein